MTRRVIRIIPLLLVSAHSIPAWANIGTAPAYGGWVLMLLLLVGGWFAERRKHH